MKHTTKEEANSDTSREIDLFFIAGNSNNDDLERPLSKFTFQGNVIQQTKTVVLRSMPFQALSYEAGA